MYGIDFKRFRKEKNLKQSELADLLGVSKSYMSEMENKKVPVSDTVLDKFKEKFGEFDEFLRMEEPEPRYGKKKNIPYYNTEVFATPSPAMEDIQAMQPEFYIPIPYFRDCDFAVRVSGDSMYPKFRHGDIIVCKEIKERDFILAGEVYFIVTKTSGYRCLKYLHYNPENTNTMMMVSHNEKAGPPQPIEKDDILHLYLVRGKIEV